jgi:multidrug transporter EmrE-like cation transporter
MLIGFLILREPFTWMKLLAVGLIATGIFMLQREGSLAVPARKTEPCLATY